MKINTKGFSMIELVMIVVVLVIVGAFVYFASQSKKVEVNGTNNPIVSTTPQKKDIVYDKKFVINLVRQIASDAEARYTGNYSKSFASANSSQDNGSGIISQNGMVASGLINDMAQVGGKVFAITNSKVSAYVLYGSLPNTNNTNFYCLGSDGSTKDSTTIVADSASLAKKPYCK